MSKAGRKLRFAVGDPQGLRGTPWSVWTYKNDVYAASRGSNGLAKVSIHESGKCHTKVGAGLLQRASATDDGDHSPYMNKWSAGLLVEPGCELKFRIIVPLADLRPFSTQDEDMLTWITPDWSGPPDMIVGLVRSDPSHRFAAGQWPGQTRGLQMLDSIELPNGQVLWVLYGQGELPPDGLKRTRAQLEQHIAHVPDLKGDLRASVVVTGNDGVGGLLELAVRRS